MLGGVVLVLPKTNMDVSEKETVLLGLLAEEASHAYGLEEKIRARQMEHWTAIGFSSIYRVLSCLEERNLIESRNEQGGQGASRKVYELTQPGWQALARGTLSCLGYMEPMRTPFSAGLANLTRAPYEAVRQIFGDRQTMGDEVIQKLNHLEAEHAPALKSIELSDMGRRRYALTLFLIFEHARQHIAAERKFLAMALAKIREAGADLFSPADLVDTEPQDTGKEMTS